MKALKFMKIDYIKTKQQMISMPLMLLIAVINVINNVTSNAVMDDLNVVVFFSYIVFMTIIF